MVFDFHRAKNDIASALPYEEADLMQAEIIVKEAAKLCATHPDRPIRQILAELRSGPASKEVEQAFKPKTQPYPRALDLHGLFSTEPDLFGGFTDVSPWVRNAEASADVTVFWRDFKDKRIEANAGDGPAFQRNEGCPVAVYHLIKFLENNGHAYRWNDNSDKWESIRPADIRPGMTLLLPAALGGYDRGLGWTGTKGGVLGKLDPPGPFFTQSHDPETETGNWVTLATHLADTELAASELADSLGLTGQFRKALQRAAAHHDIGKALTPWQQALFKCHGVVDSSRSTEPWAKSPKSKTPFRPGLRHEVASALAMWRRRYRTVDADFPTLAIYLVAAHHGKARTVLSGRASVPEPNVAGIRMSPKEPGDHAFKPPFEAWQMDFTAAEDGASGQFNDDGTFTFEAPGWTGLVADLLGGWEKDAPARTCGAVPEDEPAAFGPFVLAYLETLLRAADGRASANPSQVVA